jgi:predicted nucleotidyltransferase
VNSLDIEKTNQYLINKMPDILLGDLDKIVLYGSCARGDFSDDSDIDIALFTKCDRLTSKKYDDELMDIVTDVAMDIGTIVEYVCIPIDEYNQKKEWYGYFQNIERDGIVLYVSEV